jgi:hypothetical protein
MKQNALIPAPMLNSSILEHLPEKHCHLESERNSKEHLRFWDKARIAIAWLLAPILLPIVALLLLACAFMFAWAGSERYRD